MTVVACMGGASLWAADAIPMTVSTCVLPSATGVVMLLQCRTMARSIYIPVGSSSLNRSARSRCPPSARVAHPTSA
eukprot:1497315-Pyramimonas_sp.AAC.1